MTETTTLVEHFFRHEYAHLVSVLTRAFGVRRIDLVEDMVSAAILEAMNSWKQRGVPENPQGWIHTVARNKILDSLRREKIHEKSLAFAYSGNQKNSAQAEELIDHWLDESSLPDNLLRMMFVCCHPALDRKSQIALTLKLLCGFSIHEIARGLLIKPDSAKKRIQRAKRKLAELDIEVKFPSKNEVFSRLQVVQDVLFLLFNEGYSTTQGSEPIRDDFCEDAVRLGMLICNHSEFANPDSKALLALMLFHASRLESRTDSLGNVVLLEDQDRSKWDTSLIEAANHWLVKSVVDKPSRFHFEAVVAAKHCEASSFAETDWETIVRFYERLIELYPSPIYQLNCAIAIAQTGGFETAKKRLAAIRKEKKLDDYFLLDCAEAYVMQRIGDNQGATDRYLAALNKPISEHQATLIKKRLADIQSNDC